MKREKNIFIFSQSFFLSCISCFSFQSPFLTEVRHSLLLYICLPCPQSKPVLGALPSCPLTAVSRPHQTPFYPQPQSVTTPTYPSFTEINHPKAQNATKLDTLHLERPKKDLAKEKRFQLMQKYQVVNSMCCI